MLTLLPIVQFRPICNTRANDRIRTDHRPSADLHAGPSTTLGTSTRRPRARSGTAGDVPPTPPRVLADRRRPVRQRKARVDGHRRAPSRRRHLLRSDADTITTPASVDFRSCEIVLVGGQAIWPLPAERQFFRPLNHELRCPRRAKTGQSNAAAHQSRPAEHRLHKFWGSEDIDHRPAIQQKTNRGATVPRFVCLVPRPAPPGKCSRLQQRLEGAAGRPTYGLPWPC